MKRIINKQGLFIRDDFTFDEQTEIGLDVEASQGLYLPKWNFETLAWEESATQEMEHQQKVSQINQRMQEIVQELNSTDWKTVKYMELGQFDEEYEEHIAHRQALRDEYNELEAQL